MKNIIVITGASSGFGALAARALAQRGHIVYASMRETTGRNAPQVKEVEAYAAAHCIDLHAIELNVLSQESTDSAVKTIISENGHLDVVIHNAGHMVFGPAEAFTSEQLAQLYDTNVLSTQRVNRAALPYFRRQGKGLVVWVSSSSTRVTSVADAIVKVIDMPFGKRPFRIHIDPAQDGCEVVNAVADRIRAEFLRRIGLGDLLVPRVNNQ
jgi:NADP-dependent 3-hydroxy acid dehydrogenase YdfG